MRDSGRIRDEIILKIIENVPDNMKSTEYIMGLLKISRISTYRRLNGTLPFTYDEIAILAKEMNFSVDEVIHSESRRKYVFEFYDCFDEDIPGIILKSLQEYYSHLVMNQKMKKVHTTEITNNLGFVYTVFSDNLFKFYYYKYFQQYNLPSFKMKMEDLEIPDSIIEIKNKITDIILDTHNYSTTSILDQHIFFNTMTEVQYYYRRGLIGEKELKLIVKDISDLLYNIQKGTVQDIYNGRKYQYFIGQRIIDSNSSSIQNDNQLYSFFFHHNLHPIVCYDQRICQLHENFLQGYKRQSIFNI